MDRAGPRLAAAGDAGLVDTDRLGHYRQQLVELQVKRPRNWKTQARKVMRAIVAIEAAETALPVLDPGASDGR